MDPSSPSTSAAVADWDAPAPASAGTPPAPSHDPLYSFLLKRLCSSLYSLVTITPAAIAIESSNCCDACCGEARVLVAPAEVTSYALTSSRRGYCCRAAALSLRASANPRAAYAAPLAPADAPAALAALQEALRRASGEPALGAAPRRSFPRGGAVNCHTLKDCTTRTTDWRFGPGRGLLVALTESLAWCPACASRETLAGSTVDRVRASLAYSPVGACACKQTPSGRCSCDEYIALDLADGAQLYGGAAKGDARLVLEELAARRREALGGGAAAPEATAYALRGTDAFTGCFGAECELRVTSERVALVRHTQSPLLRGLTCGLCMGVFEETMLLEDVVSVGSARPTPCELPGAVLARMRWAAARLLAALEVGPSGAGLVTALLLAALAVALALYLASLLASWEPWAFLGWQPSLVYQIPIVGDLDEVFVIVAAAALLAFVVLVRGVDPLVLVGLLLGLALVSAVHRLRSGCARNAQLYANPPLRRFHPTGHGRVFPRRAHRARRHAALLCAHVRDDPRRLWRG